MTKEEQFDQFWAAYPRRISKGAARLSFAKAIKKTTLETMLEAIKAYKLHKPEKIDFKHPATWLNQECWDDEWDHKPSAPFGRIQSREEYLAAEMRRSQRSFQH